MSFLTPELAMGIGMVGITAVGGARAGVKDASQGTKLRAAICATSKAITKLKSAYTKLLTKDDVMMTDLMQEYKANLQNLKTEHVQLKAAKLAYKQTKRQMEIASIVFVFSIALALLLKRIGFYTLVYQALFGKN